MNAKIYSTVSLLLFFTSLIFSQTGKLAFIQNKGQWPKEIYYKADFAGGQAQVTQQGMLVGIFDLNALEARSNWGMLIEDKINGAEYLSQHKAAPNLSGHAWRMHFLNGSGVVSILSKNESREFYNFWVGNRANHASKVRSYDEITYTNVYPSVDVKYYTASNGDLENDIIVKPGGQVSNISFEMQGISDLYLNAQGGLVLKTSISDVVIPAPVSYLVDANGNRTPIESHYIVNNGVVSFDIPNYDLAQTLVIDPIVLRWATWVSNNTTGTDNHNHGIGLDAVGSLYSTGRIYGNGLITTIGAFQSTFAGNVDIWVAKYLEPATPGGSGTRVWQTYLGGDSLDNDLALEMSPDGFIYLGGNTNSDLYKTYGTGFTAGGWTQRTSNINTLTQFMLVKLDTGGNGAAVRELGTATSNFTLSNADIRVVKNGATYTLLCTGNLYLPGGTNAADGDIPAPTYPSGTAYQQPAAPEFNALVFSISSDMETIHWIKNIGADQAATKSIDWINISTVDYAGNVYIGGRTTGTANISYNNPSSQTNRTGTVDGWLMKLSSTGTMIWSRYLNSRAGDSTVVLSMELNRAGTGIVVGGITSRLANANIIAGSYRTTYGGGAEDLFVVKLPLSFASTTWGTYLGGSGIESNMMGLNLDLNDDVYILGYTASTNYPTISRPLQSANMGQNDGVFSKLSSTGTTLIYSTYFGGSTDDNDPVGQRGIQFSNCRVYLAVTAGSANLPLTTGSVTTNKLSATTIREPAILVFANPPDMNSVHISTSQTQSCGATPIAFTAPVATYNICTIRRNGVNQTNGTAGAYPSGVPTPTGYQWQLSTDYTYSWTNIAGATTQNYTSPAVFQTTYFRRIVSGDYCTMPDSVAGITITGGPNVNPTTTCAAGTLSFFANPTGGGGSNTYLWSGPLGFTSVLQNPQILGASSANNGFYSVRVTDIGGCRNTRVVYVNFNSCTYSVILTVSLVHFDAIRTGSTATLNWQTANEQNSEMFVVERSTDGKEWSVIGNLNAAGNSSKILAYNFVDHNPASGTNYYRLNIIEKGGHQKYSSIKTLNFDQHNTFNIINASPNPFGNSLVVNYYSPENGNVTLQITDALGRILAINETRANKGSNSMTFNTDEYAKGIYYVALAYNGSKSKYKMIVKE